MKFRNHVAINGTKVTSTSKLPRAIHVEIVRPSQRFSPIYVFKTVLCWVIIMSGFIQNASSRRRLSDFIHILSQHTIKI